MVNFGQFWKKHFPSKNLLWDLFGQHLDKFGLLFIPTSGHTANRQGTYVLFGTTNTSRIEKFLSKSSDRLTIEMTKTTICYLPPPHLDSDAIIAMYWSHRKGLWRLYEGSDWTMGMGTQAKVG